MLSRHHAFRIGCALTIIAGVAWWAATQHARVEISATGPIEPAKRPDTTSATEKVALQFIQIRELISQQRQLGPAGREQEDEIRRTLLSLLTDENAAKIVQALSAADLNSEFGLATLARWAATDTLAATLWLAQQPAQSAEQTWTIAQAILKDPLVLDVLREPLPPGTWREALLENASRAALVENPDDAIQLAQQMQPGSTRTRTLLMIADDWTLRDPAAATRWIANEPDLRLRDELIAASSAAQASTDPLGALSWTLGISSAGTFERSIGKITAMWADYEPERAKHLTTLVETNPIFPTP